MFFLNRPFDEARYQGLLEGLEVAEIPLSALERTKRIDAEYFQPIHLRIAETLAMHPGVPVTEVAAISDGNHFSISDEFADEGVPYYRGQDVVGHFFVEQANPVFITEKAYSAAHMVRSHLKRGDVLLSIVGTVGETSLVAADTPATCSCKLAILRPHDIAPEYLAVFLRTLHGRSQVARLTRGAVQMGLLLEDMDQIKVARLTPTFEKRITQAVLEARRCLEKAQGYTQQAERNLLHDFGLENWKPPQPLTYIRRVSDAFAAGRLDAEHFQPKYDALISVLRTAVSVFDLKPLGELSEPLKYGCSSELKYVQDGRVFLRIADLENKRFQHGSVRRVPMETKFGESDLVREGDVLVSRSGTLGIAVPISKDFAGAAYGSYFIRTRPDRSQLHPEFLSLFINSFAGQLQVEAKNTGGVQTNLTIPAIESILIPVGPMDWQLQFVEQVDAALAARRQAYELLDAAKRAVEIAIEKTETAALAFLADAEGSDA